LLDGTFIPGRSCNAKWGTRSPEKLTHILGREVLPHYDEGKHIYWRALSKSGKRKAARLGLLDLPYPKPNGAGGANLVRVEHDGNAAVSKTADRGSTPRTFANNPAQAGV